MNRLLAPLLGAFVLLAAGTARADSIDGHWCSDNGMRLSIQGNALLSPGGARMQGDYTRHAFSYQAPGGEPGAGGRVDLRLMGETAIQVSAAAGGMEPIWRRCGPPVS